MTKQFSIVNFVKDFELAHDFLRNQMGNQEILDLTGALSELKNTSTLYDVDPSGKLEDLAVSRYVTFIGEIANSFAGKKSILSFKICNTPLFWLSPLAEKHDSFHWGKNFWTLVIIARQRRQLLTDEPIILLPEEFSQIKRILDSELKRTGFKEVKIYVLTKTKKYTRKPNQFIRNIITSYLRLYKFYQRIKKCHSAVNNPDLILISKSKNAWKSNEFKDPDLNHISLYYSRFKNVYIPYLQSFNIEFSDFNDIDRDYLESFPSLKQILSLIFQQMKVYSFVSLFRIKRLLIDELEIPFNLIGNEILSGASVINFVNFLWLSNYLRRFKKSVKVFYSDEFYTTGRVISASIASSSNNNIVSFGVQHGLYNSRHTVYRIGDNEVFPNSNNGKDGIPLPNYFLVWGDYFKNIFLKYNSIESSFVIVAGNLKYILLNRNEFISSPKSDCLRVLWCTTLLTNFRQEYSILEKVLINRSLYDLVIRLHPVGHISTQNVNEILHHSILEHTKLSANKDIFQDLANCDIVITSSSSTSYLDALVANVPCIRIISGVTMPDFLNEEVENLIDCRSPSELEEALKFCKRSYTEAISVGEICYLKDNVWQSLIHQENG